MLPTQEQFSQLVKSANAGNAQALGDLRRTLDENPTIWKTLGDLGAHAESALLTLIAGNDQLTRQSVARRLQQLRSDLTGPTPTALERMAVDRIAVTWLQLTHAEVNYAGINGANMKQTSLLGRLLDQASKRHAAAIKALVDIRRLSIAAAAPRRPEPGELPSSIPFRVFGSANEEERTGTGP